MAVGSDYQRLRTAFEWSRQRMTPFRERRMSALKSYAGGNYGDAAGRQANPVNLLELAANIYRRNLAAKSPVVDVRSRSKGSRSIAKKAELMLNEILAEMDFETSLTKVVHDAIFSMGVMKIGLTSKAESNMQGVLHDAGLPFADPIDMDDLVVDMRAKSWETLQFVGNRFLIPYEMAMDSDLYDFGTESPAESRSTPYNEYGDPKALTLSRTTNGMYDDTRAEPVIELWELYLPFDKKVCTFRCDDGGTPMFDFPVREVEWQGPEIGPYVMLSLGDVPGQIMPLPPVASLIDLSEAMNRTVRKLVRQNDRSKVVGIVAAGAEDDGERVLEANDGDMIRSDRPEATRELKFGGIDQSGLAFALQLRDLFNYVGGNLDTIGGLAASANTLGQEELIKASSSQKIQEMQAKVTQFTKKCVESIGLWAWYDPTKTYTLVEDIGNTGIEVEIPLAPSEREEAEFFDLNFDITPGSLQETTSAERANTLSSVMMNYIAPLAPAMQQQGVQIDVPAFIGHMAELTGVHEITDLIVPVGGNLDPTGAVNAANLSTSDAMQPKTQREYIRRNIPTGGTRSSRDAAMTQILAGGAPGPGAEDALSRPMQGPLG